MWLISGFRQLQPTSHPPPFDCSLIGSVWSLTNVRCGLRNFLLSSAKELVAIGAAKLNRTINRAIPTVADYEIDATPPIARAVPEFEPLMGSSASNTGGSLTTARSIPCWDACAAKLSRNRDAKEWADNSQTCFWSLSWPASWPGPR